MRPASTVLRLTLHLRIRSVLLRLAVVDAAILSAVSASAVSCLAGYM